MQTILLNLRRKIRRFIRSEAMEIILIISIGAVLGANARYWLGGWAAEKFGTAFLYGTLIINLTGELYPRIIHYPGHRSLPGRS